MAHCVTCPECIRCSDEYQGAVSRLMVATTRLYLAAGKSLPPTQFTELLELVNDASAECERLWFESYRHESTHDSDPF